MIERKDFYLEFEKNAANSDDLLLASSSYFPKEGIMVGDFISATGDIAPALIPIDQTNGVCFLSTPSNEKEIKQAMQLMALRLVASVPSSKCKMLLYDGQGAGSELIHLSGLSPLIKGDSILVTLDELKNRLKTVKKDITATIQDILGAEYNNKTIVDYNSTEIDMPVPYSLIAIADFPHTLDKETVDLLLHIAKNGRKAGVYVIMNMDTHVELYGNTTAFNSIDMRPFLDIMTVIYQSHERYYIKPHFAVNTETEILNSFELHLDSSIPNNREEIIKRINFQIKSAKDNVERTILKDLLTEYVRWRQGASEYIEIPIGKTYNRSIQNITLGKEHYHCLVGGRSGMGKSILLHNIICNGAWLYSPDELQFILLDFKDGVEFNAYKDFPNVKILSVQSDISFALNVFHFLYGEMERRAELFKEKGVGKLTEYNQFAEKKLPRYLVIIDEFQKMFNTKDYAVKNDIEANIDNIVRQGRSCGINLILCTQALGNLNVSLSEFSLRIGLHFTSEKECRRICYDSTIPLSLEIGQAIYCDAPDGTKPIQFKVAYLGRTDISRLSSVLSSHKDYTPFDRFVFDGETPAEFNEIIKGDRDGNNAIYLGIPMSLKKPHCYFEFKREQGSNLLIVGQDIKASTSIVYYSMLQIMNRVFSKDAIIICDKTSEDSPTCSYLSSLSTMVNEKCKYYYYSKNDNDITNWIEDICQKLKSRREGKIKDYGEIYFVLFNSYNYQPARWKEEISSQDSRRLVEILKDGSNYGIHLIVYSDTYQHYEGSFGHQSYRYEWGIKIAVKGGSSNNILNDEVRDKLKIETKYMAIVAKNEDDIAEKIMVYKL